MLLSREKERKKKKLLPQFVHAVAVFWNKYRAVVMSDRLENVCHVAKDFRWLTWKTDNRPSQWAVENMLYFKTMVKHK